MTLGESQEIFTTNLAELLNYAKVLGFKARLREVQRPLELQKIYIEQGKSWTFNSRHLDSLAADIYFTKNGKILETKEELQILGDYWESLCYMNKWGGNYKNSIDCPHFEMNRE